MLKNAKLTTPIINSTQRMQEIKSNKYTQYVQMKYIKTSTNC